LSNPNYSHLKPLIERELNLTLSKTDEIKFTYKSNNTQSEPVKDVNGTSTTTNTSNTTNTNIEIKQNDKTTIVNNVTTTSIKTEDVNKISGDLSIGAQAGIDVKVGGLGVELEAKAFAVDVVSGEVGTRNAKWEADGNTMFDGETTLTTGIAINPGIFGYSYENVNEYSNGKINPNYSSSSHSIQYGWVINSYSSTGNTNSSQNTTTATTTDNEFKGYSLNLGASFIVGVGVEVKFGREKTTTTTSTTIISNR
jgi:hypothetical protein